MAKKNSTWQCSGTTDSPHDSFDNFGPDCSVCGSKKEDILGSGKPGKSPRKSGGGSKPPIAAIAAGLAGGLAVLGVGFLLSPNIPGLCGVAQNCQAWQNDFTKAKRNVDDAKKVAANKSASKQEMEDGQKKAGEAIKLLNTLNQQESMKKDVKTHLEAAKKVDADLATRIAGIGRIPVKPTPPTTPPQSDPLSPTKPVYVPPVSEPEPESAPIARREEPAPEPIRQSEPVTYPEPAAPQPESRPAPSRSESSAPPRDEELIPR